MQVSKRHVRTGIMSSTELWDCVVGGVLRFISPGQPPPTFGADASGMALQLIRVICNLLLCLSCALCGSKRG